VLRSCGGPRRRTLRWRPNTISTRPSGRHFTTMAEPLSVAQMSVVLVDRTVARRPRQEVSCRSRAGQHAVAIDSRILRMPYCVAAALASTAARITLDVPLELDANTRHRRRDACPAAAYQDVVHGVVRNICQARIVVEPLPMTQQHDDPTALVAMVTS